MTDLSARMANMVIRGVLKLTGKNIATARTMAGEAQTDVFVAQPAGIASNGGEMDAIILSMNGHSSKRVAVCVMDGTGTQAEEGQIVLYSPTAPQHRIVISEDGISIETDNLQINADSFEWGGRRVAVKGDKDTHGDSII